jgi:hypothetical protein
MDPDANLTEQRQIAKRLLADQDGRGEGLDAPQVMVLTARLCELVQALDEWLARGGFLPDAWRTRDGSKPHDAFLPNHRYRIRYRIEGVHRKDREAVMSFMFVDDTGRLVFDARPAWGTQELDPLWIKDSVEVPQSTPAVVDRQASRQEDSTS